MAQFSLQKVLEIMADAIIGDMENTSNLLYAERLLDVFGEDSNYEQIQEVLLQMLQTVDVQFRYEGLQGDILHAMTSGFFQSLAPLNAWLGDLSNRMGVKVVADVASSVVESLPVAFLPNAYLPDGVEYLSVVELLLIPEDKVEQASEHFSVVPGHDEQALDHEVDVSFYHPEYGSLEAGSMDSIAVDVDDILDFFNGIDCSHFNQTCRNLEDITIAECDRLAFGGEPIVGEPTVVDH